MLKKLYSFFKNRIYMHLFHSLGHVFGGTLLIAGTMVGFGNPNFLEVNGRFSFIVDRSEVSQELLK